MSRFGHRSTRRQRCYWGKEEKTCLGNIPHSTPGTVQAPHSLHWLLWKKSNPSTISMRNKVGDKHAGRPQSDMITLRSLTQTWPAASLQREQAPELIPPCLHFKSLPRNQSTQAPGPSSKSAALLRCPPPSALTALLTALSLSQHGLIDPAPHQRFSFAEVPSPPSITQYREINLKWRDWGELGCRTL